MTILNKIRSLYYVFFLKFKGATIGKNFELTGQLDILLRDNALLKNLSIGDNVKFGGKIYLRMRSKGRIIIGNNVRTGTEVWLVCGNEHTLSVGNNTILGSYSIFNGGHGLEIGSDNIFAAFVYVNTSDHGMAKADLIQNQGFVGKPIIIGDDVWLGGHVFINKGVFIGSGAVVGAGSIVTKDIPEYTIAAGNPAKVIRERV